LMANTIYLFTQSLISLPLMFEIPPVLRFIKPFRVLSLLISIIYNFLFIA
jgi:hypothetical protein